MKLFLPFCNIMKLWQICHNFVRFGTPRDRLRYSYNWHKQYSLFASFVNDANLYSYFSTNEHYYVEASHSDNNMFS